MGGLQRWHLWEDVRACPVLDTERFAVDTVQATTDPIGKVGGVSVKTCLGMGRKCRRWRGRRNEGTTRSEELEMLHGGTVTTPEGLQPMDKCKAHSHKGPWRTNTRA